MTGKKSVDYKGRPITKLDDGRVYQYGKLIYNPNDVGVKFDADEDIRQADMQAESDAGIR